MRARNIKPGFYTNETLAECSVWARLIFPGLWMMADRDGRLEDRPKRIKGQILPYDSVDVDPLLAELAGLGFIVRYQIDGDRFIEIPGFRKHQSPHYSEKPGSIKPNSAPETKSNAAPSSPDDSEKQAAMKPETLPEDSRSKPSIKRGSQPPDSLIPDSLIPDSPNVEKNKGAKTPLPDWLKAEDWKAFVEHRRRLRKPMTAEAQRRNLHELAQLRTAGHDPKAVIGQSLMRGWAGLFPINGTDGRSNGATSKQAALEARNRAAAEQWLRQSEESDATPST